MLRNRGRCGLALAALTLAGCGGVGRSFQGTVTGTTPVATLQSIEVSPSGAVLASGLTLQLAATAHYSDGATTDVTGTVSWSSSDPLVATVTSGGLVESRDHGSTLIGATLQGESGYATISNP